MGFCDASLGAAFGTGGGNTRAVGSVGGRGVGATCVGASSARARRRSSAPRGVVIAGRGGRHRRALFGAG
ncbi:MAG: hypothetical protein R3A52_18900 [Polyangiales bacterium]